MTEPIPPSARRTPKILTVKLDAAGFGTTTINGHRIPGIVGLRITSTPRELTRVTLDLIGYEINGEITDVDVETETPDADLGITGRWQTPE